MTISPSRLGRRHAIEWALYAAILLLVVAMAAYALLRERHGLETREADRLQVQARVVSANLLQQFVGIDKALAGVRDDFFSAAGSQGVPVPKSRRLKALAEAVPGLAVMLVLDARGVVIAANAPDFVGRDFAEREYFSAPRSRPDAQTLYISRPFKAVNGVWTMSISRVLTDERGRFAGVVMAGLSHDYFSVILNSVLATDDMRSTLVHGDGIVFLSAPLNPKTLGADLAGPGTFFTRHRQSGRTDTLLTGRVQAIGEDRMVATRTITQPSLRMDRPLVIHVSREMGALYAGWRLEAMRLSGGLTVLMAGAAVALALVQSRRREFEALSLEAQQVRETASRRIRTVTDNLPAMVAYVDRKQRCRFANTAAQALMGLSQQEMIGRHVAEMLSPEAYAELRPHMEAALRGEAQHFERHRVEGPQDLYLVVDYVPDVDTDHRVLGFYVMVTDITALKRVERQLDALARFDSLTGLPNRLQFDEKLAEALARAQRRGDALALMFLDVDHFKAINDTLGHPAGDAALKEFARRLQGALRDTDVVARLAGDEFVVILEGLRDAAEPVQVAQKILEQVSGAFTVEGESLAMSASIGIAFHAEGATTPAELLAQADRALYAAKAAGRSTFRLAAEVA